MKRIITYNKRSSLINILFKRMVLMLMFVYFGGALYAQEKGVSFGGHVYSDDFPITKGYAYLYRYENMDAPYMITEIDTLGFYYFYNVPQDKYIVYAGLSLDDPNFGQFAFTYYPNVALWQDARPIAPTSDTWNYHIHLINQDPENNLSGAGRISGKVDNGNSDMVDVMLFDPTLKKVISHMPVNKRGSFEFNNLPWGEYVLYPQVVGLSTQPKLLYINEQTSFLSDLEIEVSTQVSVVGIEETEKILSNYELDFYTANSNSINFKLYSPKTEVIDYTLFNLNGQIVAQGKWNTTAGSYDYNVDVWHMPTQMYFLQLSDKNNVVLKAKCLF